MPGQLSAFFMFFIQCFITNPFCWTCCTQEICIYITSTHILHSQSLSTTHAQKTAFSKPGRTWRLFQNNNHNNKNKKKGGEDGMGWHINRQSNHNITYLGKSDPPTTYPLSTWFWNSTLNFKAQKWVYCTSRSRHSEDWQIDSFFLILWVVVHGRS